MIGVRFGSFVATAMAVVLGLSIASTVHADDGPEGYDNYLVYLMNGVVEADAPGLLPEGEFFQTEIMGRTEDEAADEYARAEEYFLGRFGVDFAAVEAVDGTKTVDNLTLDTRGFMLAPERAYRVYTIAGMDVPDDGWEVRDGGWAVMVGDGGATLNGEWGGADGTQVAAGSMFVFGDYNIDTSAGQDDILIHYQSSAPIVPTVTGVQAFSCELIHPDWGTGLANGVILPPEDLGDGTIKIAVRNVLTFPGR
jgi:hypothetical protein